MNSNDSTNLPLAPHKWLLTTMPTNLHSFTFLLHLAPNKNERTRFSPRLSSSLGSADKRQAQLLSCTACLVWGSLCVPTARATRPKLALEKDSSHKQFKHCSQTLKEGGEVAPSLWSPEGICPDAFFPGRIHTTSSTQTDNAVNLT